MFTSINNFLQKCYFKEVLDNDRPNVIVLYFIIFERNPNRISREKSY